MNYLLIRSILFVAIKLIFIQVVTAQLIINEISSNNKSTLQDNEGDYPDWIELFNESTDTVNLNGYTISDDREELDKYIIPDINIAPFSYLILFASGKNYVSDVTYWETLVGNGQIAKYILPNSQTDNNWIEKDFNDQNWLNGQYGIGYGDEDDETVVSNGTQSIFARSYFQVDDLKSVKSMILHMDYDDAFVAYLNGTEIARENITGDAPLAHDHQADSYTEPRIPTGQYPWEKDISEYISLLEEGKNVLALQVHNFNTGSSDLTAYPFLSLGFKSEINNSNGTNEILEISDIRERKIHTNFKLSSKGETIYISDTDSVVIDSLNYPVLISDESYGLINNPDSVEYGIFNNPTPGTENGTSGYNKRLKIPELNYYGGFYDGFISLKLHESGSDNDEMPPVYYTTDGSIPTSESLLLNGNQLDFFRTGIVRLRAIQKNALPSPIQTETYFIQQNHDLPVISISTHPRNLWSDEEGIYVVGTNGIGGNGHEKANWNQDWEIPVGFEYYNEDGIREINTAAGAKIFGGWSRLNPMKSLSIFFRSEYGLGEVDLKLFESKDISKFESIVLRNSGNDFTSQGHSMFRDGLMSTLVNDTEIDNNAFQPSVVYLNGEYWGIHNIREKLNEHYVESNSYADSEYIDLIGNGGGVSQFRAVHGSAEKYDDLIRYSTSRPLGFRQFYDEVETMLDIDNYIDYHLTQIYYSNTDWPGNNTKIWRSRNQDGKWRWILYDTDFGFNLRYGGNVSHNTLTFALDPSGPGWPNPPWSTRLLRNMFDSPIFKVKFANRMADLMNKNFKPSHVHMVIDSLSNLIESEIPRHMNTETRSGAYGGTVDGWYDQISLMKDFGTERPRWIEQHFTQPISQGGKLGVGPLVDTTIRLSHKNRGVVVINRLVIDESIAQILSNSLVWTGKYFSNVEIPVRAQSRKGYEFIGWTGDIISNNPTITITAGVNIAANFAPASSENEIVITEIMYNSDDEIDSGDWVEIFNNKNSDIDLTDWVLKDEDDGHEFLFSDGTILKSGNYAIIVRDSVKFKEVYDHSVDILGEMDFGLAGGSDDVRIFDNFGVIIDSVSYDDESPWPVEADGQGYSLELINIESDNSIAESWQASKYAQGSPGLENGILIDNEKYNSDLPTTYHLSQNYPNPFNPSTWIEFAIPKSGFVKIEIYSSLGQKVAELANNNYPAGSHAVEFNANLLASGVYFYKLITPDFEKTRKMLLIK